MLLLKIYNLPSKNIIKSFYLIALFLLIFCNNQLFSQDLPATFESDFLDYLTDYKTDNPTGNNSDNQINYNPENEVRIDNRLSDYLTNIEGRPIGSKYQKGFGNLHIVIESVEALNHSVISKKADRVEIWLGHRLLQRLEKDDSRVLDHKTSRIFNFPLLTFENGYYFLSVRLYAKGVLWKGKKFHEEIYQVGIHDGKLTKLQKKIPFLNW